MGGRIAVSVGLVAAAAGLAAPPAAGQSGPLTVYSSLPLQGASRPQSEAIVRGIGLALADAGGTAGGRVLRYISLDGASRRAGAWTPELVSLNARRAALRESTIAYIGEFNSGASAISIPILNEAQVPQISPTNTAIGLTRGGLGADRGEPAKYYPRGLRHFFRLAPTDSVQGAALARAMRDRGCERIAVLDDSEVYGRGLAAHVRRAAARLGTQVVYTATMRPRRLAGRLARAARRAGAQCVAYGGITANGAVRLFRALARALPRAQLFGGDGIANAGFTDPGAGGVPPAVGAHILITLNTLDPSAYPPAGQELLRRAGPDPHALRGYEAMRLVIDALNAGAADRAGVIRYLRAVRERDSVLGRHGFDRFGDTTLRSFGLYGIQGGALRWSGAVTP